MLDNGMLPHLLLPVQFAKDGLAHGKANRDENVLGASKLSVDSYRNAVSGGYEPHLRQ